MTKAIIYVRTAPQNPAGLCRQENNCREYLRERGLVHVAMLAQTGRPDEKLLALTSTVAEVEATEVIVSALRRLGRKPSFVSENLDALDHAGLTIHVADGTLTGPLGDECTQDMSTLFALEDTPRSEGETPRQRCQPPLGNRSRPSRTA